MNIIEQKKHFVKSYRLILAIILCLSFISIPTEKARASTFVGGPITTNTTWTVANSPYIVIASIDVWEGVTLTIEPGVTVKFNYGYSLQVSGELLAPGTYSQPITFTSNQITPAPDNWGNISFTNSAITTTMDMDGNYISGSILQFCIVEYAGFNVENTVETHSLLVDNCIVRNNGARGIYTEGTLGAPGRISHNIVSGNTNGSYELWGAGIYAYGNSTVFDNNVSNNTNTECVNGGGIGAISGPLVIGNTVTNNYSWCSGGGIGLRWATGIGNTVNGNLADRGDGGGIWAYDSTVSDNSVNGNISHSQGGGIWAEGGSVIDNTVSENTATGDGGGIWLNSSSSGNIVIYNISNDRGGGIYSYGSPVIESIVSDNYARSSGGGIYAWSNSTIISNTISFNSVSANGQGPAIDFIGHGLINANSIVGNKPKLTPVTGTFIGGLYINGDPQAHNDNIYGNTIYDVVVNSNSDISGTLNYWGTTNSSDILSQIYDWYDDNSRGKFIFNPYTSALNPEAPLPPPLGLVGDFQENSVALNWDPLPSSGIDWGYKVYYDSDSRLPPYIGTGLIEGNSPIDIGNITSFSLSGLDPMKVYYFTLTAYDNTGRESWYSKLVNKINYTYLPIIED